MILPQQRCLSSAASPLVSDYHGIRRSICCSMWFWYIIHHDQSGLRFGLKWPILTQKRSILPSNDITNHDFWRRNSRLSERRFLRLRLLQVIYMQQTTISHWQSTMFLLRNDSFLLKQWQFPTKKRSLCSLLTQPEIPALLYTIRTACVAGEFCDKIMTNFAFKMMNSVL